MQSGMGKVKSGNPIRLYIVENIRMEWYNIHRNKCILFAEWRL